MSENYCPSCGLQKSYGRTLAYYPDGPDLNKNICSKCGQTLMSADATIAALRAELERKDAVILNLYQFTEHSDTCWRDEVSRDRPCICGLDNALKEADAALQPKEPPCKA